MPLQNSCSITAENSHPLDNYHEFPVFDALVLSNFRRYFQSYETDTY